MIVLDKVFRQKDSSFLRLLNELRRGIVSSTTNQTLSKKVQDNRSKNAEKKSSGFQKSSSLSTSVSASTMASRQGQGQGRDEDDEVAVRPTKLYATNRSLISYHHLFSAADEPSPLCCVVIFCIVLYCIVLYCVVLHFIELFWVYCVTSCSVVLYCAVSMLRFE